MSIRIEFNGDTGPVLNEIVGFANFVVTGLRASQPAPKPETVQAEPTGEPAAPTEPNPPPTEETKPPEGEVIPPKRTRKAKDEPAKPVVVVDNTPAKVDFESLRAKLLDVSKKHGAAQAYEVLKGFGVEKLREIPEDKWPDAMAAAEAKLAADA